MEKISPTMCGVSWAFAEAATSPHGQLKTGGGVFCPIGENGGQPPIR